MRGWVLVVSHRGDVGMTRRGKQDFGLRSGGLEMPVSIFRILAPTHPLQVPQNQTKAKHLLAAAFYGAAA